MNVYIAALLGVLAVACWYILYKILKDEPRLQSEKKVR